MSRAHNSPLRPLAVLAAILMVVLSFGMAGTATAASGGNGAGTGQSSDPTATSTTDTSTSPGNSAQAKGQSDTKGKADTKNGTTPTDHQTSGTAGTSGTPPEKQPLSGADQNQGGANGECPGGPYCGTERDKASANGNGGGQASGKPCAGCVGKADNKNPQGQYPGPQDNNNGYECDGNHGIARGNPAHTGCTTAPPTTTTEKCVPKANEYVDASGNCVKKSDDNCVPTATNKFCAGGDDTCVPGQGEMVNAEGECVPVCPTDSSIPMDDEDCNPAIVPEEETPVSNRPPTVAGVEAFAPQPPAAVEQYAGPQPPAAVGPSGILPSTGASTMMNALAATGFGLLLLGSALLFRRKAQQA